MSYLEVCKISKNNSDDGLVGYVNPRLYAYWEETNPMILIIEGIHQFCVKAVKKIFPLKAHIQLIPVQLKDVRFTGAINYDAFKIVGKVMAMGDLLRVEFAAKRRSLIATGAVIVSDLKGISE